MEENEQDLDTPNTDEDDHDLSVWDRCKYFVSTYWRGIIFILTPLLLIPLLTPFPPKKYQWCAFTLCIMAVYWMVECIPLAITSFLPLVIFPLTSIMTSAEVCNCYMNDTVLMFLGSLILACAVEQSGLHVRLALCAIRAIGYSHYRLLFAICFITMFISMWITNTAATSMMVPIVFAVLKVFEDQQILKIYETDNYGNRIASDITTCYFCAATFSATVGGIGTLVGTATNLVFKGLFTRIYPNAPEYLSFPNFSGFTIPYMIIMQLAIYFVMLVQYCGFLRKNSEAAKSCKIPPSGIEAAKEEVEEQWKSLGKISFREIMVIILFSAAILLFFSLSPQVFYGWGDAINDHFDLDDHKFVRDSAAAMVIVFLMALLPSTLIIFKNFTAKTYEELPSSTVTSVLDWTLMNESMPYSFMFLLGGGFALSEAAKPEYTDLNGKIGEILKQMANLPNIVIILFIIIFTILVTNFASNVAVCNVIAPIAMQLAKEIGKNPLWYDIAAGLSASYAYMLPVGTPGNLVVQSAASIPTGNMIKAGILPTVVTIIISWIAICFWAPVVWPDLLTKTEWLFF